eukprot:637761-Rhodomonas_salina.3
MLPAALPPGSSITYVSTGHRIAPAPEEEQQQEQKGGEEERKNPESARIWPESAEIWPDSAGIGPESAAMWLNECGCWAGANVSGSSVSRSSPRHGHRNLLSASAAPHWASGPGIAQQAQRQAEEQTCMYSLAVSPGCLVVQGAESAPLSTQRTLSRRQSAPFPCFGLGAPFAMSVPGMVERIPVGIDLVGWISRATADSISTCENSSRRRVSGGYRTPRTGGTRQPA